MQPPGVRLSRKLGGKRAPFSGEMQPGQDTRLGECRSPASESFVQRKLFIPARRPWSSPSTLAPEHLLSVGHFWEGAPGEQDSPWRWLDVRSTWENRPASSRPTQEAGADPGCRPDNPTSRGMGWGSLEPTSVHPPFWPHSFSLLIPRTYAKCILKSKTP